MIKSFKEILLFSQKYLREMAVVDNNIFGRALKNELNKITDLTPENIEDIVRKVISTNHNFIPFAIKTTSTGIFNLNFDIIVMTEDYKNYIIQKFKEETKIELNKDRPDKRKIKRNNYIENHIVVDNPPYKIINDWLDVIFSRDNEYYQYLDIIKTAFFKIYSLLPNLPD